MRLERFSEAAQAAFQEAQEIMHEQHHTQLDVEHIFLALLRQHDGVAGQVLVRLGGDKGKIAERVERELEKAPKVYGQYGYGSQVYITPRTQRLVKRAEEYANRLDDEYIGVEHVLLAINSEREGGSARVLQAFDIAPESFKNAVKEARRTMMSIPGSPEAPQPGEARHSAAVEQAIEALKAEVASLRRDRVSEQPEAVELRAALEQARQHITTLELENQHLQDLLQATQGHLAYTRGLLDQEIALRHWADRQRGERQEAGGDQSSA